MKKSYQDILEGNRRWVEQKLKLDDKYFKEMAKGQSPDFLWIGCSDSRVPPNEITGTGPGDLFVHRNIANMVLHNDKNLLSVLQFSVEILKIRDVILCGHYGCGGILAAMSNKQFGLLDNWLCHIKDVYQKYKAELDAITCYVERAKRLVELNTIEQVQNLSRTIIIQNAWGKASLPYLHAWVYDIETGLIKDMKVTINNTYETKIIKKM